MQKHIKQIKHLLYHEQGFEFYVPLLFGIRHFVELISKEWTLFSQTIELNQLGDAFKADHIQGTHLPSCVHNHTYIGGWYIHAPTCEAIRT